MNVETVEDLFLRELLRAYSIENELIDELATLRDDADVDALDGINHGESREAIIEVIEDHVAETEEHVSRLEDAFDALDRQAEVRSTPALDGIVSEKERFNNVVLNDEVRPVYYVGTAAEIENLEITVYERLVRLAEHLDVPGTVIEALETNLEEDRATAESLASVAESDDVESLVDATIAATEYE